MTPIEELTQALQDLQNRIGVYTPIENPTQYAYNIGDVCRELLIPPHMALMFLQFNLQPLTIQSEGHSITLLTITKDDVYELIRSFETPETHKLHLLMMAVNESDTSSPDETPGESSPDWESFA